MDIEKVFSALSSTTRRSILAYLSATDMTAGEIAARFNLAKGTLSKHLDVLENAELIKSKKEGKFIHYSLNGDNVVNVLNSYVQQICPVGRPLLKESEERARAKITQL